MARIEYEPRSVRELLTEIKDVSDTMIDLAYAGLLFESKEIAGQVRGLENRMDELMYHIRIIATLSARSADDAEKISGVLQIANAVEMISNATGDLADLILRDIDVHPVVQDALRKADEKITRVRAARGSLLTSKKLSQLRLPSSVGVWVLAIKRDRKWMLDPSPRTRLKAGDTLIAVGSEEGIDTLHEMAGVSKPSWAVGRRLRRLRDTLAGMRDLDCMLVDMAYSSVLFRSRDVAEEVREMEEKFDKLNYEVWLAVLRAAKRERDVAQLNSVLQVAKCLERISDAADSIADVVLRRVELHPVFEQALEESDEKIARVRVSKRSPLANRTLGKLDLWPRMGAFVLMVKRGRHYMFNPGRGTTVRPGDSIIISGSHLGVKNLEKVAAGRAELPPLQD